jgi:hypothetical protein
VASSEADRENVVQKVPDEAMEPVASKDAERRATLAPETVTAPVPLTAVDRSKVVQNVPEDAMEAVAETEADRTWTRIAEVVIAPTASREAVRLWIGPPPGGKTPIPALRNERPWRAI